MSYRIEEVAIESHFGVTVANRYFVQEPPSERLMIVLPGRGYLCDYPLLYYLRTVALQRGWDVLCIQYAFQVTGEALPAERMPDVWADVQAAAGQVLARDYQQVCVAGKSMGTPLAIQLINEVHIERRALILLTPVGRADKMTGEFPALAVIGTADPYFPQVEPVDTPLLCWRVFEGLDHSLESSGDWRGSLRALESVATACERFLEGL